MFKFVALGQLWEADRRMTCGNVHGGDEYEGRVTPQRDHEPHKIVGRSSGRTVWCAGIENGQTPRVWTDFESGVGDPSWRRVVYR